MAKLGGSGAIESNTRKRPGVHAKAGSSKNKKSKNYKKPYKGQGR